MYLIIIKLVELSVPLETKNSADHMYLISSPWYLRILYPKFTWHIPTKDKEIYLTFDDGPHEIATPFVLNLLEKYHAKATFFCIGKNVEEHPEIYKRIQAQGHTVGNHTHNHLNGFKTKDGDYIKDIYEAKKVISSTLFRPPYGRIKRFQVRLMEEANFELQTIMWDVLSGDFDTSISGEKCFENVKKNTGKGSIVVFHDSSKAFSRLEYALPQTLSYFTEKGFVFKSLKNNS